MVAVVELADRTAVVHAVMAAWTAVQVDASSISAVDADPNAVSLEWDLAAMILPRLPVPLAVPIAAMQAVHVVDGAWVCSSEAELAMHYLTFVLTVKVV